MQTMMIQRERDAIARRLEDAADRRAAESEKAVLLSDISEGAKLEESELLGISGQISKRARPPARKSVQVLAFASAKANESTILISASANANESTTSASTNANESAVSNSPAQHGGWPSSRSIKQPKGSYHPLKASSLNKSSF